MAAVATASQLEQFFFEEEIMIQGQMILRLKEYGEAVVKSLKSSDPRLSPSVRLTFIDGSQSTIPNAFPEAAGDWLYVFSKSDGYYLFRKPNVINWTQETTPTGTMITRQPVAHGEVYQAA
ncbi:MAG: hypothetical protein JO353_12570 [Phycisphaerae bacterium]|nr:hypothetical protein [Phycisphaerae bacterium]